MFKIPTHASPAESWILLILQETGGIKPAAKRLNLTVRRVQQVVAKYQINIVNH